LACNARKAGWRDMFWLYLPDRPGPAAPAFLPSGKGLQAAGNLLTGSDGTWTK